MLNKKNILGVLFLLTYSATLDAGFPINPDGQEESMNFGKQFNAVGRIDLEGRGTGSAVLIDVRSIGLPSILQNRVIATVSHVFPAVIEAFGHDSFPKKLLSPENTKAVSEKLKDYSFRVNLENDSTKPNNYRSFDIQQVFMCDMYRPHDKTVKLLDQVAFAILKEAVENVTPVPLMEAKVGEYLGKNVYQVGYGASGFMNSRKFFYDGVKRAGGITITAVHPTSSFIEYEMKFDDYGQAPQAALSPDGDSITLKLDNVEQTMEIGRLDSSLNSPVFQQLLKHFNIIHIYRQIQAEMGMLDRDPYNRSKLYHYWHGVKLVSPIRLTKAPRNPIIAQSGDSGAASLYHDGHQWGLAGLVLASNPGIRYTEEPLSWRQYLLKVLYSRRFLHRFLPDIKNTELSPLQEPEAGRLTRYTTMNDGQEKLEQMGIRAYARHLNQWDDSSYFSRTFSRLKHKVKRALGLYQYPSLAVTIVTPYSYALSFANTLKSMESSQSADSMTEIKPLILYPLR